MALFRGDEVLLARTISRLDYCNPFLQERLDLEREALGPEFVGFQRFMSLRIDRPDLIDENVTRLVERVERLVETVRERLVRGVAASADEKILYEDVVFFALYHRHLTELYAWIQKALDGAGRKRIGFYEDFETSARHTLSIPGVTLPHTETEAHLFAFFIQLSRAFVSIYSHVVGSSMAAARLRGAIWQSIFTHDLRRYRRSLYARMADITSLVTGPSGTGKELVARAIGLSRYIPFDPKTRMLDEDFVASFHALNLSALSPTLIESELFGHRRGAFTGALEDRKGWFEVCRPLGTVFLDEIGDLDGSIQIKLLRVLQTRTFQRLGDRDPRRFEGKVIAATNRNLAEEMRKGRFREDFYYRLCADLIVTPSLRDQLGDSEEELRQLVLFVAQRLTGQEASSVTEEVVEWIENHLGLDYSWPGNFRELEQCVRNILIRKEYRPTPRPTADDDAGFLSQVASGSLTADDLLRGYCKLVHARTGNLAKTARKLGVDRRTVKAKLEPSKGSDAEA